MRFNLKHFCSWFNNSRDKKISHTYLIKRFNPPLFREICYISENTFLSAIIIELLEFDNEDELGAMLIFYGTDLWHQEADSLLCDWVYVSLDEAYDALLSEFGLSPKDFIPLSENEMQQFKLNND